MNTSKNLLISILFLFVFVIGLSSVYSNEQKIANSFRYLEDEDLDTDSLEEKNNKIIYYDCKDEEIRKSKCELKNMNCTEDYNCTCKNGYVTLDNSKYCEIARKKKTINSFFTRIICWIWCWTFLSSSLSDGLFEISCVCFWNICYLFIPINC